RRRAGPSRAGADARREAGHALRRRGALSMTGPDTPRTGTQVLVVGSGIAGLTAALRASRTADVLLVTKGALTDGATACAQGGIAGAAARCHSPAQHAQDTVAAGAGLCAADAVRELCEEGPAAVEALIAHGVAFDQRGVTEPSRSPYALGLEGAHG